MKKYLRTITLALGLASGGQAFAGIPTIDLAAIAQAVLQVQAWGQQYQQMTQQVQQMQQQLDGVTGGRGMSSLLNDPEYQNARRTLPPDAQQVLGLANGGSYGNLAGSISSIKRAASSLDSRSFNSPTAASQWDADLNQAATNQALSMQAYSDAAPRLQNIEDLMARISQTQDPKAIAELQARMSAEQAIIQNEQNRIQALAMLVSSQQQMAQLKVREVSIRSAGSLDRVRRIQIEP